jgi:hypothetical protein
MNNWYTIIFFKKGSLDMKNFPEFMNNPLNKIAPSQQNADANEGSYSEGANGSQIAFCECHSDRISEKNFGKLRGKANVKMTTDEIMALTRGSK